MQSAIIIGVGPVDGLGAQLCRRFAQAGFHVHVAGRTESKLGDVAALIESEGGQASISVTDATDEAQISSLFEKACESGQMALAIYNVGNNTPGLIAEMEADYFLKSWQSGARRTGEEHGSLALHAPACGVPDPAVSLLRTGRHPRRFGVWRRRTGSRTTRGDLRQHARPAQ